MKLNICKIKFETDIKIAEKDLKKIRGYLGNEFIEKDLLHNHDNDKLKYRYPLIQYKFIKNEFFIIGINEGVETLLQILPNLNEFILDYKTIKIKKKLIELWEDNIKLDTSFKIYEFTSPYFALSQKNYDLYKSMTGSLEKKKLLDRILIGNILSFFKLLGIRAENEIIADIFIDRFSALEFKDKKMVGFKGEFALNLVLPDYIGLGKSVALGNGSIRKR